MQKLFLFQKDILKRISLVMRRFALQ